MRKGLRILALSLLFVGAVTVAHAAALRNGDQGEEVVKVQTALVSLGYHVVADGDFGPATAEAVRQFQASAGLEADGLVGATTYRALLGRDMPEVSRGSTALVRRVVNTSMQYVGVPYQYGGMSPGGFDCSGYIRYVFANAGISMPRAADEQYERGTVVSYGDLQVGDLVFFSTYAPGASHVGIYLGSGQFIHASTSRGVIVDNLASSYWSSCYIGARRVL